MAALSPHQSGRAYAQESEGRTWGHRKNSSSQDTRQNFSYPNAYSQSPPQSPRSNEDFVAASTLPSEKAASSFNFSQNSHAPPDTALSDRAANRRDNSRTRYNELSRKQSYGEGLDEDMDRYSKGSQGGGIRTKSLGNKKVFSDQDDKSDWIHRDKLTQIEIQEHIALGREVPLELLRKAEERQRNGQKPISNKPNRALDYGADHSYDVKWQRITSPSPDEESYEDDDEPFVPIDPRSPEEIAAEEEAQMDHPPAIYQQRLRSSSSRIPLSTTSMVPVPQQHLDRNTRLPRKRGASGNWEEETIAYPKTRSRSHSVGSQVLLDDDPVSSNPGSPSKAKTPAKGIPQGRKGSANLRLASTSKSRQPSSTKNSPAGRPSTRDGRPSTAVNRPEGDPPWLASMYKPDPRLPPDQQIIPTHAKRIMQEQWEKEGKVGQVYDHDFRPIQLYPDTEPPNRHSPSPSPFPAPELNPEDAQNGQFPMRDPSPSLSAQRLQLSPQITQGSQRGQQSPVRSQTNGEVHGGYSTIPKVQSTPVLGGTSPRPEQRERFDVEELNEKQEKKSGCGCCIVM